MKRYVKVIKNPRFEQWYRKGQLFEFERESLTPAGNKPCFLVTASARIGDTAYVFTEDAMIIETENREATAGEQVLITRDGKRYSRGDVVTAGKVTPMGDVLSYDPFKPYWEARTTIRRNSYEVVIVNSSNASKDTTSKKPIRAVSADRVVGSSSFVAGDKTNAIIRRFTDKLQELQQIAKELKETAAYEYSRGFEAGRKQVRQESDDTTTLPKGRAEIVLAAKNDVERLVTLGAKELYSVRFTTGTERNRVTALVYRPKIGQQYVVDPVPDHIGSASCLKSDCFNIHIGKAIALRRALKLEVPSEYLNAPPPVGVEVGDYVVIKSNPGKLPRVFKKQYDDVLTVQFCRPTSTRTYYPGASKYFVISEVYRVVDDSERYR